MSLIFNSIISSFHSALNGFWSLFYGVSASVHIVDWKHYPHADIYLEHYVSTVGQLYAEDIQVGVKYTRNRNGAILGYLDDDALIDVTRSAAWYLVQRQQRSEVEFHRSESVHLRNAGEDTATGQYPQERMHQRG